MTGECRSKRFPAVCSAHRTDRLSIGDAVRLKALCTAADISRAEVRRPADLMHLQSEVRRMCGLQRTNTTTSRTLLHALHCKLRWHGKVWEQATFAGLLLQAGWAQPPYDTVLYIIYIFCPTATTSFP